MSIPPLQIDSWILAPFVLEVIWFWIHNRHVLNYVKINSVHLKILSLSYPIPVIICNTSVGIWGHIIFPVVYQS